MPGGFDGGEVVGEVPGARPAPAQFVGVALAELATPLIDGLVGDDHAALGHHQLNIAQAQWEAVIKPHAAMISAGNR